MFNTHLTLIYRINQSACQYGTALARHLFRYIKSQSDSIWLSMCTAYSPNKGWSRFFSGNADETASVLTTFFNDSVLNSWRKHNL